MANKLVCPHCRRPLKIIPLKSKSGPAFSRTFESTTTQEIPDDQTPWVSWAFDGKNYAIAGLYAGGIVWMFCWWYEYPPAWAVASGLLAGVGLHLLKIILHAPPRPKEPEPEESVSVTMTTPLPSGNTIQLDETFDVPARALRHVARRVIQQGKTFSRRKCTHRGKCSQSQFDRIRDVMLVRHWAVHDPTHPQAGVTLNRHGRAILRAVLK